MKMNDEVTRKQAMAILGKLPDKADDCYKTVIPEDVHMPHAPITFKFQVRILKASMGLKGQSHRYF